MTGYGPERWSGSTRRKFVRSNDDSGIVLEILVQLAPPDVEGSHRSCTSIQGNLGEPTCRGPDVQHDLAGEFYREGIEGCQQLDGPRDTHLRSSATNTIGVSAETSEAGLGVGCLTSTLDSEISR